MSQEPTVAPAATERGHAGRSEGGRLAVRPRAVLSELLGEVAREPVQVEVSAVRVLFELLGFLLKMQLSDLQPSAVSNFKTSTYPAYLLLFRFSS